MFDLSVVVSLQEGLGPESRLSLRALSDMRLRLMGERAAILPDFPKFRTEALEVKAGHGCFKRGENAMGMETF